MWKFTDLQAILKNSELVVWKFSVKKIRKNFAKYIVKHLSRCLIFNKVAGSVPVKFEKYSRTIS